MLKAMSASDLAEQPELLMARVAGGDRDAFRVLTRRLHAPALRLATKVLGDAAEAEDAVQTALVKLWTQAERFDGSKGTVDGWFRRLLVNCCLDRRRSIRPVAPLEAAEHMPADGPLPDEVAVSRDRAARIDSAMARLNPRQRAAIALFYGEGASMAEIAVTLGTTAKAVEGLLARARAELAVMLKELAR